MFRLHESTRTFLCRLGFILLGLLPTCCCAAYAVFVNRISYQQQLAAEFGRNLNLIAECDSATYPLPHLLRFTGLVLRDPETRAVIASAATLDASIDELGSHVHSPAIVSDWSGRERFMTLCQDRLLAGNAPLHPIHFSFDKVEIAGLLPERMVFTLHRVRAEDGTYNNGRTQVVRFYLHPEDALYTEIRAQRSMMANALQPNVQYPYTALEINTGSTPVPCALFGGIDSIAALGKDASFSGHATQFYANENQKLILTDSIFSNIDLSRAIGAKFSQRLAGLANVQCNRLVIDDGRIVDWSGKIWTGKGQIGRQLAKSLVEKLRLQELMPANDSLAVIDFDQFACGVEWRDGNVQLQGACRGMNGVMLTNATGLPLWNEPTGSIGPPAVLLQAFAPEGLLQVPAMPTVGEFLRRFPMTPAIPAPQGAPGQQDMSAQQARSNPIDKALRK